jgi:transposase-like protein
VQFASVVNLLDLQSGIGEIAAAMGLSRQTVYRIYRMRDGRAAAEAS